MKTKIWVTFFTLLTTALCQAGGCNSDYCEAKVKKLYVHENGKVYVQSDADMSTLDCTLDQGNFIVLTDSNGRFNEIYSMLLSAFMADKEVKIRILNGSPNCSLTYAQLNL